LGFAIKGLTLTLKAHYMPRHAKPSRTSVIPEPIIFLLTSDLFNHPTVE